MTKKLADQVATVMAVVGLLVCPLMAKADGIPKGFAEKYADVNGVRLHYYIGGKGTAVVLLHGYAVTSHMWFPLMPLLAENGVCTPVAGFTEKMPPFESASN